MSWRLSDLLFGLALTTAVAIALLRGGAEPPQFAANEYQPPSPATQQPLFQTDFVSPANLTPVVHSGTLVGLPDGGLLAAWFGGSREGAADVAIWGARWDGRVWSQPWVLTNRGDSQRELGRSLRKLGNPVLMADAQGRIWLFYVTVSLGGWSTSSISYKISEDGGRHWSPARRLVTSPFHNISTLIRNRPLLYRDGSIALPAYHEMIGKFGELLRLDAEDGRVLAKQRMSSGREAIQPSIVATDALRAAAFFRRVGEIPRVLTANSGDGGASWSPLEPTNLPNPDAGVCALGLPGGGYLLAYNPSERGRDTLGLALSSDGQQWRRVFDLERGNPKDEFSYPFLIRTHAGEYHLIYTWQRQRMAHVRFNDAWLERLQ